MPKQAIIASNQFIPIKKIRIFSHLVGGIGGVKDSSEMIKNYKGLEVWQKAYQLCIKTHKITKGFPKSEGGEIWINFTDKEGCCISSTKYRRGVWKEDNTGVYAGIIHSLWFQLRVGDSDLVIG